MFERRSLADDVAAVREAHAADALVLDCERDFETLPPAQAEGLGPLVEGLSPASYPTDWLPADAPDALVRYAGQEFTVGAPGDGGVTWTRQIDPPVVIVKARLDRSPSDFVDFLVAEALVEVGLSVPVGGPLPADMAGDGPPADGPNGDSASDAASDETVPVPEHFLGFFRDRYRNLASASPLSPEGTYQVAAALYDAWLGLHTRERFAEWGGEVDRDAGAGRLDRLHAAWVDAGERLEPRLDDLSGEVARGETSFSTATELACAGVKHDLDLPTPFAALDNGAHRRQGPAYAVEWAERTFESLDAGD